ncbi:IS1182 family transposase [Myroides albus]|uniref:IS1182 family transposase n=1 Tax=Myroides albus TaxID=2562892 RepID=UPI0021591765|nr:IS1182 family transposase [Myroides albus]UVD80523.1 IS1182 family transposase [Myroides albus]
MFKSESLKSPSLFPEDIFSKIPLDHPVRLINAVVDELDISSILSQYKGGGTTSYHPRMMIKVLFYAYFNNIYSSRKIERALTENIYFMWLSGNSLPDHRTINYFRAKRLKGQIHQLFADVVRLLQELQYVSLQVQYIDGTKIESSSNRYTFVWRGSVEKNKAKLETKIQDVLTEIEGQIKQDQSELAKEHCSKNIDSLELKEKVTQLNKHRADLPKPTAKQLKQLEDEHLPRLQKYEQQLETLGTRNSYSKTDPDATFMRMKEDHMKNGQLKPAYNTQISTENQFITHYTIAQKSTDTTTLINHLETFEQTYAQQSKEVVADAGYGSEENYLYLLEREITPYVKFNYFHMEQKRAWKNNPFLQHNLYYNKLFDYILCPNGEKLPNIGSSTKYTTTGFASKTHLYQASNCLKCSLKELCNKAAENRTVSMNHRLVQIKQHIRELLNSERGKYHRSKRPVEVEAVFGQLKSNNKFTRFTLRGLEMVEIEFGLMALAHNLRKLTKNREKSTLNNNFHPKKETDKRKMTNYKSKTRFNCKNF